MLEKRGEVDCLLHCQVYYSELRTGRQYSSRYAPSRILVLGSGCWRRDEMSTRVPFATAPLN
jgi:hypothetical protein